MGDLFYRGFRALEPLDREREVQWLLDLPDSLMLARRQHLSRTSDCDPGNGHRFSRGEVGLEMDDAVDTHFAALAEVSGMKDCCTRSNEYLIFHGATHDVSIRADQAVIADAQRVPSGTSENRAFHDDALAADGYGPALSDDLRPEHHATARADGDVAADDGIGRHPGGGIDSWRAA
jgi:hypothetical protein